MRTLNRPVLVAAAVMYAAWLALNVGRIRDVQEGIIQLVLGTLFSVLVLVRWKAENPAVGRPVGVLLTVAAFGFVLAGTGIIFRVHQFEWLGLILVMYSCLRFGMRPEAGKDVALAMFLLYWVNPLPTQVFGGLQMGMQRLSVIGTERLLHVLNQRVWADGFVLYSGAFTYGVPESCSGMRTAVTVFLCMMGVGVLFRFRWYTQAAFLALAMGQVLILNVLRIAGMALWAPRMPSEWAAGFLHDSLGVLLFICIVTVLLEALWWRSRSDIRQLRDSGIAAGEVERPERGTILPRFWRWLFRWGVPAMGAVALFALLALAVYKQRPSHKVAMIAGVVESRLEVDPEVALRAAEAALRIRPDDRSLQSRRCQLLVIRGRFEEGLNSFDRLAPPLSPFETMLKSRALMALGRTEESVALIETLPVEIQNLPAVAMLRAEYDVIRNRPEMAAAHVIIAGRSARETPRVRLLYPYLASREQWRAIVKSDNAEIPYATANQAMIAIYASLRIGDYSAAGRALSLALKGWPNDIRFLDNLATMAVRTPGSEWEEAFASCLLANIASLDADALTGYFEQCARVCRPDLMWQVYSRLVILDKDDPFVFLAPAQFGGMWFDVRRHKIGVEAPSADDRVDLQPILALTRRVRPFAGLWPLIPLASPVSGRIAVENRTALLNRCLAELGKRESEKRLTRRMMMSYPMALAIAGRYTEAHVKLNDVEREYPGLKTYVAFMHAMFFSQEKKWQETYEAIVRYDEVAEWPNLTVELIRIETLLRLNFGLAAMEVAQQAEVLFPGSMEVRAAQAAIWDLFGYKDQALFTLTRSSDPRSRLAMAHLMMDTGRFEEGEKIARGLGVRVDQERKAANQPLVLEFAERTLARRLPPPLTSSQIEEESARFRGGMAASFSPFVKRLAELELAWYAAADKVAEVQKWEAAGRNAAEKVSALHRIAVLAARQKEDECAKAALQSAVRLAPESAILRRLQIMLSAGDYAVVVGALASCNDDPEVWLAYLVARFQHEGAGPWALEEVKKASESMVFSQDTLVRAGDFCLRKGMTDAAVMLAREAMAKSQGLLASYVLGLQCGLVNRDVKWAVECASKGVELAADPVPFYKVIVGLKTASKVSDADLFAALEHLKDKFPSQTYWGERLGTLYFEKGDHRRAVNILGRLIDADIKQVRIKSLLLASESARVDGDSRRAVEILEAASALYPSEVGVLNNLVYSLLEREDSVVRAAEYLPRLLEKSSRSAEVLDTAAMVHLRMGRLDDAKRFTEEALRKCDDTSYGALEVHLNAAEIYLRLKDLDKAQAQVEVVRKKTDRPGHIEKRVADLTRRIDVERRAQRAGKVNR